MQGRTLAATIAAFSLTCACAQAATVSVRADTRFTNQITFTAAPGEANDVTVTWTQVLYPAFGTDNGSLVRINDAGAVLAADPADQVNGPIVGVRACTAVGLHEVDCVVDKPKLVLDLGDGDDRADVRDGPAQGDGAQQVIAGDGNDSVLGARFSSTDLGPGDDRYEGSGVVVDGPGADTIVGGSWDTTVDLVGGDDDVHGGWNTAVHFLGSAPLQVTVDDLANDGRQGEHANIHSDVKQIFGGDGNDVLTGGPGNDNLYGEGGDDLLAGGPGFDGLDGGPGNDTLDSGADPGSLGGGAGDDHIMARNGARDAIVCGDGSDTAVVDVTEQYVLGCEAVDAG